jgi:hypothetical protein
MNTVIKKQATHANPTHHACKVYLLNGDSPTLYTHLAARSVELHILNATDVNRLLGRSTAPFDDVNSFVRDCPFGGRAA